MLWETRLGTSAQGFPMTFSVDGKQYIAIAAGLGGGSPRNVPAAVAPEIKIPQAGQALYVFTLPERNEDSSVPTERLGLMREGRRSDAGERSSAAGLICRVASHDRRCSLETFGEKSRQGDRRRAGHSRRRDRRRHEHRNECARRSGDGSAAATCSGPPPGVDSLRTICRAFRPRSRQQIELQAEQTVRLDVAPSSESVEAAVEATGTAPMINIMDAMVGVVVDKK